MALFWKIAAPVTCAATICAAVVLWPAYREKAIERKAAKACRIRAEQGDASAQVSLGKLYYRGKGVSRNYAEAVRWYRKAAEQGDANGQTSLGYMYR